MKSSRPIKDVCARECRRPNAYYLGSAESPTSDSFSVWLKSSLSDGVPLLHAVLKWDLLSDRPAYMGGVSAVLYRPVVSARPAKIFAPCQMFAAANISTFFLGKIKNLTRLISVLSLPFKFVHNHKTCLNSAASLLSL